MRGDQDDFVEGDPRYIVPDRDALLRIEAGGRFVEDEDFGLPEAGLREGQTLLHAVGLRADLPPQHIHRRAP